jgi:UDP-3-O-[3-hydroxymyristoyl] glucosamine N-acyltransferase
MIEISKIIQTLNPNKSLINVNVAIKDVIKLDVENKRQDVIFWVNEKNFALLEKIEFGTIITPNLKIGTPKTTCNYLQFDNPRTAFTNLLLEFFIEEDNEREISQSAKINLDSDIGKNCKIGHNVVIEKNCKIGNNVTIGHNTVILKNTIIKDNVIIGSNNTIGSIGYGYEKDLLGNFQLIPHIGGIIIEEQVEIGSNTCIDKAVLGNTIIGFNTKIDNLVHIAHNVKIGKNCAIIANSMIGGGTIIEDNSWISPNVALRDNITIGENTLIGLGSIITKSVPKNEIWMGNPGKKYIKS